MEENLLKSMLRMTQKKRSDFINDFFLLSFSKGGKEGNAQTTFEVFFGSRKSHSTYGIFEIRMTVKRNVVDLGEDAP